MSIEAFPDGTEVRMSLRSVSGALPALVGVAMLLQLAAPR
jgi:hypothetical protein